MKKLKKKNLHRILAMVLVLSMLGANMTTLSFATEDDPAPQENSCTLLEHVHSDACKTKTLICELPDHEHVGTCYEYREEITCGLEESEEHTHSETCMKQVADLICQEHVHSDACYQLSEEPTCGLQEHTHSEECEPEENGEEEKAPEQKETCEYCGAELTEEPEHADDCLSRCTCQTETGVHGEGCPLQRNRTLESVYGVTVSGDLPEGAELSVQVLSDLDLQDFTLSELENIVFALDVSILVGGNEYQPTSDVTVTVKLPANYRELCGVSRASELLGVLSLYHLHELGIEAVAFSADDETDTLTFIVGGFSEFVAVIAADELSGTVTIGTVPYPINSVETLVDANLALMRNEAMGTHEDAVPDAQISAVIGGTTLYGFEAVYGAVYELLLENETHTYSGQTINTAAQITDTQIWEVSGEVRVDACQTISDGGRLIIVSDDPTASIRTMRATTTFYLESESAVLSIQGKTKQSPVYVTNNSKTTQVLEVFAINNSGGSVYLNYTDISKLYSDGTDKCGFLGFASDVDLNRARFLYMSHSKMHDIWGKASPGIFCRAYNETKDGANDRNQLSRLWLYDNDFERCESNYPKSTVARGGPVIRSYAADNSTLRVEFCRFTGNTATVNPEQASGGGAIYWKSAAGSATLVDCTFTSNTTNAVGGAIYNTGTMTIQKCGFTTNSADLNGGAIAVEPPRLTDHYDSIDTQNLSGSLTLDSQTTLQENQATNGYGGGIYFYGAKGTNGTKSDGEDIKSFDMQLIIDGATITGNQAKYGGAIAMKLDHGAYQYETGVLIKPGSEITNNKATQDGGAIWMDAAKNCDITNSAGVLMSGGTVSGNEATRYGGTVYMSSATTKGNMKFQMNAGEINTGHAQSGGAVYMTAGTFDVSGNSTIETCTSSASGGAVYMTAGTFTLAENGAIQNCTATTNGGAVYLQGGTVDITGGAMMANQAQDGAGAYMAGGEMTVSGTAGITGNTASTNGGGAYLADGTLSVTGGSFTGNSAVDGGGAYMGGGTLNVSGGSFTTNSATNGAGAYMAGGTMNISGTSEITANIASANGGGAYLADGTLSVTGGSIASNSAANGAGVYMGGGEMTVSGSAGITGNTATANGGGAYLADGTLSVTGGSVASNNAANGAGVYMGGGTMTVSDTAGITGNTATANGGGAYLANGTLNIKGGQVNNNSAAGNGGGAFLSGGKLELTGGELMQNTALSGGGAYLQNGNVTMSGGTVSENTATAGDGGGMYVSAEGQNVNVLIYSGSFVKNEAANAGGALAVCGNASGTEKINVVIGLHEIHAYTNGTLNPVEHDSYCHESCPVISENVSYQKGGAILISGGINTSLSIYCLDEANNRVGDGKDQPSNFMMVEGGKVVVSTAKTMGEGDSDKDDNQYGDAEIENSVYVVGGQVDLYGATSNPNFGDAVTVDIPKNDTTSHFEDHRFSDEYFTIIYFENFKDPQTGNVSGQYKSYQIPKGTEETIKGVIYNHPGYEILGWYTDQDGHNDNVDHSPSGSAAGKYEVGQKYLFDGNPIGDLIIFAQWVPTGYWVRYDANIQGAVYSGSMGDQPFKYDEVGNLALVGFEYPGHRFVGWLDAEGSEYADGAEVENLTDEKNGVVTLYAQWEVCDHKKYCTYTYTQISPTEMKRECSCGGQTIFVSVYAQSVTYDGQMHPVQLIHTHPGSWEFVETYTKDGASFEGTPKDAGVYTYTVWAPVVSNPDGMSLSVTYTIEKANQPKPPVPIYTIDGDRLTVTPVENSPAVAIDDAVKTQYRLVYYTGTNDPHTSDWGDGTEFTLPTGYTNYYVEAMYTGSTNHYASEATRSGYYFHIGQASVVVIVESGMYCDDPVGDPEQGGAEITVHAENGYYLRSTVSATSSQAGTSIVKETADSETAIFQLSNIPNKDVTITVHITGVGSELTVQSAVTETEVFTAISGDSASITQESAFTAYYRITNYSTDVYSGLGLSFASPIPKGTTILLMDKSEAKTAWWSYTASGSVSSVPLELFTRMGSNEPFAAKNGTLQYQFIVDFAEAASSPGAGSMNMTLKATKGDANAKELNQKVNVALTQKQSFTASAGSDGMIATVSLVVNSPQDSTSTKWDGSRLALVLTPPANIPPDARLQVEGSTRLVVVHRNADGNYVIPCGVVTRDVVMFRLISDLLPASETTYKFTAKWVASGSLSASAVANGTELASANVSIIKPAETRPSLEITGGERLFNVGDTMTVNLQYIKEGNCEISAQLQRLNENGGYSNTGLDLNVSSSGPLAVPLAGQNPGDFRLYVEIRSGQQVLAQMSYYFILQS